MTGSGPPVCARPAEDDVTGDPRCHPGNPARLVVPDRQRRMARQGGAGRRCVGPELPGDGRRFEGEIQTLGYRISTVFLTEPISYDHAIVFLCDLYAR